MRKHCFCLDKECPFVKAQIILCKMQAKIPVTESERSFYREFGLYDDKARLNDPDMRDQRTRGISKKLFDWMDACRQLTTEV